MKGVHGRAATQLAAVLLLLATASTAEEGGTGVPGEKCVPARIDGAPVELRTSRGNGFTVDACGRRHWDKGRTHRVAPESSAAEPATIDRMTTRYQSTSYWPGEGLVLMGSAVVYTLSDGVSWQSGGGDVSIYFTEVDRVEVSGTTIRYVLRTPPFSGTLYRQTDYNWGNHSAGGTLAAAGPLVLEATTGSTTAVLRGSALIMANAAPPEGSNFHPYSANVGSVVPFELTYALLEGGTWQPDTFSSRFDYEMSGVVDFAHPVFVPRAVQLRILGPSKVPDESAIQFSATVRYENGIERPVTAEAAWSVQPAAHAHIANGLLETARLVAPEEVLTLGATFTDGTASLSATKRVRCQVGGGLESPTAWPMFQANARHTGYLPLSLKPAEARLRWEVFLEVFRSVNAVAGADGKVFATLQTYPFHNGPLFFALDASNGRILWSQEFGDVFSVNPPSAAYGTVYVQTNNHASDTWLRAFDALTGVQIFQAPHAAQWETYNAPTIHEGKAYVNGGVYGGMYKFDAFSGEEAWYGSLPQYDGWTPAVAGDFAYAYVGNNNAGLYAFDRVSGAREFVIKDSDFEWSWSMNVAPVVGDHDDILVIQNSRLLSFDLADRSIRWTQARSFQGQPSVAKDRIYAVDGNRVVVLDELTGADLWSWQPPEGAPTGTLIVTDRHFLVSTASNVYAVDLASHQAVWSFPAAGRLALADGNLYVASNYGSLTAIAMPNLPFRPQPVWQEFFAVSRLETPYAGDFDGDGRTDVITFTRQNPAAVGDVYVALSNGKRFGPAQKWHDWFALSTDETVVIGDYDGDGKDDIATWLGKSTRQVYVAKSLGTSLAMESVWLGSLGADPSDVVRAGDVNGDGKDDLVLFARKQASVYVALSTGSGFQPPQLWHSFFAVSTYERPRVADLDGDRKADIVTFATDSPTAFGDVYVALSDGTKFGDGHNSTKWHDWFAIRPQEEVRIGDLDGDGRADFFTFLPPPFAQCYRVLSQGTSMGENVLWPEAVAPHLGSGDTVEVGDVNGDHKADIIIFDQTEGKVFVSLAR